MVSNKAGAETFNVINVLRHGQRSFRRDFYPACVLTFCVSPVQNNKIFADLKAINKLQLEEEGIKDIDIMEYCSVCQNDLFFSYRKEKGITARHSAVMKIKRG